MQQVYTLRSNTAFTVLEMVVVVAILGVLLLIGFVALPAANHYRQDAVCLNRLKELGGALLNYAVDHQGTLPSRQLRDPETNKRVYYWMEALKKKKYFAQFAPHNPVFECPLGPKSGDRNECYGMREWRGPLVEHDAELPLHRIETPSAFFLIADSIQYGGASPRQWYTIQKAGHSNAVHLRHRGKAHAVFADGHVEALGAEYFETLHLRQPGFTLHPFEAVSTGRR